MTGLSCGEEMYVYAFSREKSFYNEKWEKRNGRGGGCGLSGRKKGVGEAFKGWRTGKNVPVEDGKGFSVLRD